MAAVVFTIVIMLFRDLRLLTFDPTYPWISGTNVPLLDLILHIPIAVTSVMGANVVGIVMIMNLMTIPAAMGNLFSFGMKGRVVFGTINAVVLSVLGLMISLHMDDLPGATVVLVLGAAFLTIVILRKAMIKADSD